MNNLINLDFANPSLIYRLKYGGGGKQAIAKAIKVNKKSIKIIDATAGFGTDALVLAGLKCQVYAIEKNPIIFNLLQDRLTKAINHDFLAPLVKNIKLIFGDARIIIPEIVNNYKYIPDVIYLDPMFKKKNRTAAPNKQIQILQNILKQEIKQETNNLKLLTVCLQHAAIKVVVKRPKISEYLENIKPNFSFLGKANRFDIYFTKK